MTAAPSFIVWSEIFAVGHQGLDAEHRRLVEIINEISAAQRRKQTPDQLRILLHDFEFEAVKHFRHENSVMCLEVPEKMSTNDINEHLAEHALALSKLKSIIRDFCAIPNAETPLSGDLRDWFVEHAIKYDAHLKAVFQAN